MQPFQGGTFTLISLLILFVNDTEMKDWDFFYCASVQPWEVVTEFKKKKIEGDHLHV